MSKLVDNMIMDAQVTASLTQSKLDALVSMVQIGDLKIKRNLRWLQPTSHITSAERMRIAAELLDLVSKRTKCLDRIAELLEHQDEPVTTD